MFRTCLPWQEEGVQTRSAVNINSVVTNFLKAPECEKILSDNPRMQVHADLQADILNIMGSRYIFIKP